MCCCGVSELHLERNTKLRICLARTNAVVRNTESTHKIAEVRGIDVLAVPIPTIVYGYRGALWRRVDVLGIII